VKLRWRTCAKVAVSSLHSLSRRPWKHLTSSNFSICQRWFGTNFRQACTADQKDEVEFLDVNHCITADDDFGFVTEDFVKPTAEGRQFINGKSHSSQSYLEKQ